MNCGSVSLLKAPTARCGCPELKLVTFVAHTEADSARLSQAPGRPTDARNDSHPTVSLISFVLQSKCCNSIRPRNLSSACPKSPSHESKHQDPWASWSIAHLPLYQSSPADRTFPRGHASPTAPAFSAADDFTTTGRTCVDDAESPTIAFPAFQAPRLIAAVVLLPVLGHLSSAPRLFRKLRSRRWGFGPECARFSARKTCEIFPRTSLMSSRT